MDLTKILSQKMGFGRSTLENRVAVVTGAARGLGKQTAIGLSILGARVVLIDKDERHLEETARRISSRAGQSWPMLMDISEDGALLGGIEKVCNSWGAVDILVNNAAAAFIGSVLEETQEIWDVIFNTNLRIPAAAIRAVLPKMKTRGYGVIANIISLEGLSYSTAYSATKVGLRSLTTSISTEIGHDTGISIFSFAPGIVDTPLVNDYFYPELAKRFGMSMQDIIEGVGGNPGYKGLMPAHHCGAALINCIVNARNYNGQIINPFLPLAQAGVISMDDWEGGENSSVASGDGSSGAALNSSLREYLKSVMEINTNLEHRIKVRTEELVQANTELKRALAEVKQLSGLLPICASCKNIRNDQGYWSKIENYLSENTGAEFTHAICPKCVKKLYPDLKIDE